MVVLSLTLLLVMGSCIAVDLKIQALSRDQGGLEFANIIP